MSAIFKKFEQLYVGVRDATTDDVKPLAFMTPYEENNAGRKRQETVDNWLNSRNYHYDPVTRTNVKKPTKEGVVIDNEALEGFRISDSVKRTGWNGGNVVWRIEDPRGWELEITSSNLAMIIEETGILPNGVIPGKAVWCRVGSNNVLVPTESASYKQVIADEALMNQAKTVRTTSKINPGDRVRLRNGTESWYLGQFYALMTQNHQVVEICKTVAWFAFESGDGFVHLYKNSPAISVVTSATQESISKCATMAKDWKFVHIQNRPAEYGSVYALLEQIPTKVSFAAVPTIYNELDRAVCVVDIAKDGINFTRKPGKYERHRSYLTIDGDRLVFPADNMSTFMGIGNAVPSYDNLPVLKIIMDADGIKYDVRR